MSPFLLPDAGSLLVHLGRATISGAVFIALVALLFRAVPKMPAGLRCGLWWLACLKLLLGLVWVEPFQLAVLPASWGGPLTPGPSPARAGEGGRMAGVGVARSDGAVGEGGVGWQRALTGRNDLAGRQPSPSGWAITGRADGALAASGGGLSSLSGGSWRIGLLVLWLTGLALEVGLLGWGLWRSRRLILRSPLVREPALVSLFSRLARLLGLRREPELRLSAEVQTPQALGGLRPRVLLPQRRVAALSADEIEMTLCHELVHVRRGDLWLAWVPALAQRIFFFFPPAAWAAREYLVAREAACDAEVLRVLGSAPQAYGRLLLQWGVAPRETGLAAAGASPSLVNLKRRLQMLHETSDSSRRPRLRWGLAGAAALVALIPFTIVAQPPAPEPEAPIAAEEPVAAPAPEEAAPAAEAPEALAPEEAAPAVWPDEPPLREDEPTPAPEAGEAVAALAPEAAEDATPAVEPAYPVEGAPVPEAAPAVPGATVWPAPRPVAVPTPRPSRSGVPAPVAAPRAPRAVPAPPPVPRAAGVPSVAPRAALAAPRPVPQPPLARAPRTPQPAPMAPGAYPAPPPGAPVVTPAPPGWAPRTPSPKAAPGTPAPPPVKAPRTPAPEAAPAIALSPAPAVWTPRPPGASAPRAVARIASTPPPPVAWTRPRVAGAPRPGSAPRAALPGAKGTPVAQGAPAPPAPPAPPAAPKPPKDGKHHRTANWTSDDEDNAWVYLSGNDTSMSGSRSDLDRARRLRGSESEHLLWFKRDGKTYVVRDKATLDRVEALWRPVGELGAKQGALGAKQGKLGAQQGALGAQQGAIGTQMGALGARQARASEDEDAKLEQESHELERQMDKLSEQQEALGRQQEVLGRQQEELGRQQEAASAKAESELKKLMTDAIRSGLAQPADK